MTPYDKPKSRLETHAPRCTRCRAPMKVRTLDAFTSLGAPLTNRTGRGGATA
jgi:hypothetical protein